MKTIYYTRGTVVHTYILTSIYRLWFEFWNSLHIKQIYPSLLNNFYVCFLFSVHIQVGAVYRKIYAQKVLCIYEYTLAT